MKNRIIVNDIRDVPREYIALSDYNNTALAAELSALATKEKIRSYKAGGKAKTGRVFIHPADFAEVAKKYDESGKKANKSSSGVSLLEMQKQINDLVFSHNELFKDVQELKNELGI